MSLADQIERSSRGEAWHGPSVIEALEGVTASRAALRPHPELHTIWELVLHVTAWQRLALATLGGEAYVSMTGADDWPPPPADLSEANWQTALAEMAGINAELVEATRGFPEWRLRELVPGRSFDFEFLLLGIVQHNVYHAGQIALLKRLQMTNAA